ncbi:MAG: hypothetical protein ACRCVV_04450, partial [Shewanella sp.]
AVVLARIVHQVNVAHVVIAQRLSVSLAQLLLVISPLLTANPAQINLPVSVSRVNHAKSKPYTAFAVNLA